MTTTKTHEVPDRTGLVLATAADEMAVAVAGRIDQDDDRALSWVRNRWIPRRRLANLAIERRLIREIRIGAATAAGRSGDSHHLDGS